jgi:hypothetical protein
MRRGEGGHVVVAAGEVVAGPFTSEALAWGWIDRNEVHEVWQRDKHKRSKWSRR